MPQILMPYTVHLDHTLRVTPLNTLFAKGDSAAHRFELTIIRSSVQEDLTGCTVLGKFYRMADSTVVSVPGFVEGGKAVVSLHAACYDYIGRFALTIAIQKGEEETTVFYGDGYMHGQRADTSISGEYIIYDINTLIEKIAEIDAATQAANTATANANTATGKANTAANAANTAADAANAAAKDWGDSTAANSYKLGGKAPEYYLQPMNLLDNSNFRNPVEQAWRNGLHGTQKYAIDRWMTEQGIDASGSPGSDLVLVSDKTNWIAGIVQNIDTKLFSRNKVYTFAVYGYINNACRLMAYNGDDSFGFKYFIGNAAWETYILTFTIPDTFTGDYVRFLISTDTEMTGNTVYLRWAALYEGSYTDETLPPYVPKGYAAELAECQRYYHLYATSAARPSNGLDCCPPMRISGVTQGTTTVDGETRYYNSADL